MKLKVIIFATVCLFFASCKKEVNQEEVMGQAAKQYYIYLINGKYDAWIDGFFHSQPLRKEYRSQLIDNAKMFMYQQKEEHKGIKSFDLKDTKLDTLKNVANVFLNLTYGDNSQEQIVVPMVKNKGVWYMR